jgi:hypothetical protein
MPDVGIDLTAIEGFAKASRAGRPILLRHLARAYGQIGNYDIDTLRADLPGKMNIRSKGLAKSFKAKATDPGRATGFEKLFADEYTGWKAAGVFQTGGTITGRGKSLTILFSEARSGGGRRKYTQSELRQMIAAGSVRLVPTPRGVLIVQSKGGVTKTGKGRKNSRDVILGILKKQVHERKRLDFFENAERNGSMHQDILETAVENTLVEIAQQI